MDTGATMVQPLLRSVYLLLVLLCLSTHAKRNISRYYEEFKAELFPSVLLDSDVIVSVNLSVRLASVDDEPAHTSLVLSFNSDSDIIHRVQSAKICPKSARQDPACFTALKVHDKKSVNVTMDYSLLKVHGRAFVVILKFQPSHPFPNSTFFRVYSWLHNETHKVLLYNKTQNVINITMYGVDLPLKHQKEEPPRKVSSGDKIWYNFTIGPVTHPVLDPKAKLDLFSPTLFVAFRAGADQQVGVDWLWKNDTRTRVLTRNPDVSKGVRLPNITDGDGIEVSIPVLVTDKMTYNEPLNISVHLEFNDDQDKPRQTSITDHTFTTADLTFDPNDVNVSVPYPMYLYSTIDIRVPITLLSPGQVRVAADIDVEPPEDTDIFSSLDLSHSGSPDLVFSSSRLTKRAVSVSSTYGYFQLPAGSSSGTAVVVISVFPVVSPATPATVTPIVRLGFTQYNLPSFTVPILPAPVLQVSKNVTRLLSTSTDSYNDKLLFSVLVSHAPTSTGTAHDITITDDLFGFDVDDNSVSTNFISSATVTESGGLRYYSWTNSTLPQGQSLLVSYNARLVNDADYTKLPSGKSDFYSKVVYHQSPLSAGSVPSVLVFANVCVSRDDSFSEEVYVEYGYVVLLAVVGLILGAVIGVVIVCCALRSKCSPRVSPEQLKEVDDDILDNVILNQHDVQKRSHLKAGDKRRRPASSLVGVLAQDQKMKQYRKLDSLDVADTEEVDDDIENESTNNRVRSSTLLVESLLRNGDIDQPTRQKTTALFKKDLHENDQKLEQHYKNELDTILHQLVARNKRQFGDLVGLQKQEKKKLKATVKNLSKPDQEQMMKLLEEKHKMEQQELGHQLALAQDEEIESVRKDFAVRRRLQTKDLQNRYLDSVIEEGKLQGDQVDWLLKQHMDQQNKLEELHDQEIINQRILLEEKLARRKQLAQKVDAQDENGNEILAAIEQQNMQLLERAKKLGVLDKDEVKTMASHLIDQMISIKEKHEKERAEQQKKLEQEMLKKRKNRVDDKKKVHEKDVKELEAKLASEELEGTVDPMAMVEARHNMLALHRAELVELENEEDDAEALELMKVRDDVLNSMQNDLETMTDELVKRLEDEGMDRAAINKLLKQHRRELDRLRESQDEDRRLQEDAFKRNLEKNRKKWAERREQEKNDQLKLREHEESVVRNIMSHQVAMSVEERERVMREYEQQMVKMENSLTLNKLRQRKKLEERIAEQKKQQMQKLEKRHHVETKKMKRRHKEDEDDMDRSEIEDEVMSLMKKQVNQKLSVLHGDKIKLSDQLTKIESELAEERAMDVKKQEEELAAMVAAHQLEKAKEVAKINEQQRAIEDLKNSLLTNLSHSNVVSDPECEQIIARHHKEKERLNRKQDSERSKQERLVQERLAERRKQMETQLAEKHEREMEKVMGSAKNKASAKFARAVLVNQHMMEREQFKNRLEKEIDQTLQDIHHQHVMRKQQTLQELEMKFIAGLIRLGKVERAEILQVLRSLCPLKSEEEIATMYQQISDSQQISASQPVSR